jgi:LysM domain
MKNPDRLYDLVPVVYQERDVQQGSPLQALLRVITEQVDVVEQNISQLYENWFIETCDEWVVPYIGDLIGYQLLNDAGQPSNVTTPRQQQRERILIPRQDVANTIHARRRKGTLAVLEELATDVAGWPSRAVEFYKLLGWTQNIHSPSLHQPLYHLARIGDTLASVAARYRITEKELLRLNPSVVSGKPLSVGTRLLVGRSPARGKTADLRNVHAMDLIETPFETVAHTVDVRRIDSQQTVGLYNISSVGLYVWRLQNFSVGWSAWQPPQWTGTPACCCDDEGEQCYTFSVLGNDTPLYNRPQTASQPTQMPGELNLPTPIRRLLFHQHPTDYYGAGASLAIWAPDWPRKGAGSPIPASAIAVADLSNWQYPAPKDKVLVDPESGRMVFPLHQLPKQGVTVYYQYAFSADMGGGEYDRPISQPANAKIYRVGQPTVPPSTTALYQTINAALDAWSSDKLAGGASSVPSAVIEITDSGVYTEKLNLSLGAGESLQIRAANRTRPVIRFLAPSANKPEALVIKGAKGSRCTLDGLLVTGRGLVVQGQDMNPDEPAPEPDPGDMCDVTIRHCTLVPGWGLHCDCGPRRPTEPSLTLLNTKARIKIEHSILGAIEVTADAATIDPVAIRISDSIWDAMNAASKALGDPDGEIAYASLTVIRTTVLGEVAAHAVGLAENSIFTGSLCVARRQSGCVRFCYVPPCSRTPRRYECQPDLVVQAVNAALAQGAITQAESVGEIATEQVRVEPQFNSIRYGTPTYCQLADACAAEIKTGAEDESEIGAFHDLYQPQRTANLLLRLIEYTPASMDAGIINAT